MSDILNEITFLDPQEVFYIAERYKSTFDYPKHCHAAFELNFVEHGSGVRRMIGDSNETIGEYDLVLMTGPKLVHIWEQGDCKEEIIHEITIHFSPDVFGGPLAGKRQFASIRRMIQRAQCGLAFSQETTIAIRNDINQLAKLGTSFEAVVFFLQILYKLSLAPDAREVATSSFVEAEENVQEDWRITAVKNHFEQHYDREIRLPELAKMVCMSPESFTRFFRQHTGKTPMRYIIEYRLGVAARMLINTQLSVSEIGFSCGFNTPSHFNRLFKEAKGCTPSEFREKY